LNDSLTRFENERMRSSQIKSRLQFEVKVLPIYNQNDQNLSDSNNFKDGFEFARAHALNGILCKGLSWISIQLNIKLGRKRQEKG